MHRLVRTQSDTQFAKSGLISVNQLITQVCEVGVKYHLLLYMPVLYYTHIPSTTVGCHSCEYIANSCC